jgi:lipopolysaccharide O-acetyltransferase
VRGITSAAGRAFAAGYRFSRRVRAKAFSVLIGLGFASFGSRTVLQPPVRLEGERHIRVGDDVFVGAGSWLQVLGEHAPGDIVVSIGSGTSIAGSCVISAASSVRIGADVLMARNVYIADHSHAYLDVARPVIDQGITNIRPVTIEDGAWLGQNVVICPGVRVGRGAVVGANAVVRHDIPDHAVAAGVPATVVRVFASPAEVPG